MVFSDMGNFRVELKLKGLWKYICGCDDILLYCVCTNEINDEILECNK